MEEYLRFFMVFADILIPMCIGRLLRRWGLAREWVRLLIRINVVGAISILSVISFWSLHATAELLWLPISILPICFLSVPVFYLLDKHRFTDPRDQGSYLIVMMLGNIGTLAGLCAYVLYGEIGFAYTQLIAVPQILVIVLFCFPAAQRYHDLWANGEQSVKHKTRLRDLLLTWNQLPAVGVLVGLPLSELSVPRPEAISTAFTFLIHASAWMGMIPVGYDLNFSGVRAYAWKLWPIFPVKFLYLPLCLAAMTLCFTDNPMLLWCVVLSAAAPTAIFAVAATQLYGLNVDIAESSFITSTLAFLFVVYPFIYYLAAM